MMIKSFYTKFAHILTILRVNDGQVYRFFAIESVNYGGLKGAQSEING